jgi:hypothetical protein
MKIFDRFDPNWRTTRKIVNLSLTRGHFGEVRCIQISTAKGLETRGISRVIIINGEKKDATYGASMC